MKHSLLIALTIGCAAMIASAQQDSAAPAGQAAAVETKTNEDVATLKGKVNGLEEDYLATKATVDKIAKIKISGYIQAQVRTAVNYKDATDTTALHNTPNKVGTYNYPVGDFSGGAFSPLVGSDFMIRRGRIKIAYEQPLTQAVVQLDIVPFKTLNLVNGVTTTTTKVDSTNDSAKVTVVKGVATTTKAALSGGGVTVKDVYFRFAEPWLKSFALKGGIFDRPFGFEISYSSSSRESPERSRMFQTLFPGERDLGVSLEYLGADNLPAWAQCINFKGGLFTGNGINVETDNNRDFIGRLGFAIPLNSINLSIDGGASLYEGAVQVLAANSFYKYKTSTNAWAIDSSVKIYDNAKREYIGGDMQLYYGNLPFFGGVSLRGEGITGVQPGTASANPGAVSANGSPKSDIPNTGAVYSRNFQGYYANLVLNIDPLKSQIVFKYDDLDPNTDISGNMVKSLADLEFKTTGIGLIYHWDENVKLVAYYENIVNEKTTGILVNPGNGAVTATNPAIALYNKDVKDDVFTFRIQYKF